MLQGVWQPTTGTPREALWRRTMNPGQIRDADEVTCSAAISAFEGDVDGCTATEVVPKLDK